MPKILITIPKTGNKFILFFLINFLYISVGSAQQEYFNFSPGSLWQDTDGNQINAHGGGILFHEGTYYWFGEHKESGRSGNKAQVGVHVYASRDLYNWKDQGIALKVSQDSTSLIQKGCVIERPKVIFNKKTNKFVMWFHHELKGQGYSAALAGVAVADRVTGPYTYIKSSRLHAGILPLNFSKEAFLKAQKDLNLRGGNLKKDSKHYAYFIRDFKTGQMSRDMTLFVDDDGMAYQITASEENQTIHISKLSDDFLSVTKDYIRVFPGGTNEAPALFKKDGKYFMFLSGCTGWDPNPAKVAVSDNLLGHWKLLGNPCIGTTQEQHTTFWSQSTFVIPIQGSKNNFIFMADRWNPKNPIDGRYVWLPVLFENDTPVLKWFDSWDLSIFQKSID